MKLTIDRKTWLRGVGSGKSGLRRKVGNRYKKCCLGFLGEACGIPIKKLTGLGSPSDLPRGFDGLWPEGSILLDGSWRDDSGVINDLMTVNDDMTRVEKEREEEITKLMKELDVEVEFIN